MYLFIYLFSRKNILNAWENRRRIKNKGAVRSLDDSV